MAKFEYPHQNLSLENMKGEQWEDIPNLDGYYLVSNFGRIKRLQRDEIDKYDNVRVLPEQINKPSIQKTKNRFKNDVVFSLRITVKLNKINYCFGVARLVYYCFVEAFDLKDRGILILCKDYNGFNVYQKNLVKSTSSERGKIVVQRRRADSHFQYFTEKDKKRNIKSIKLALSKKVSQYNIDGKKIKTYKSCNAAEHATGIAEGMVSHAARGAGLSAGGYLWKWGNEKEIESLESIKNKRQEAYRLKHGQKVTQYDFGGNKIAQYNSLQEAAIACGGIAHHIDEVTKGKAKSAKGYFWQSGFGKDKINLKGHLWGGMASASGRFVKVKQYALDGKLVKIYVTLAEAARAIKVTPKSVKQACENKGAAFKGFKWKYA
jgi:hypothetical protein